MQSLQTKLVMGSALLAAVAGCYPKAGPPPGSVSPNSVTWAEKQWPGATAESLAAGRESFLAKCNGCHSYPDRNAIADEKWPSIIERMGKKADLDDKKREELLHYVLASRHP